MSAKTKKPDPGSLEDLERRAAEIRVWKGEHHPDAPMDLKGFAYAFAGKRAAENPDLYDQHAVLAALWAEGEAMWWRTIAQIHKYEAARRFDKMHRALHPDLFKRGVAR